jgi:hypothetical protein
MFLKTKPARRRVSPVLVCFFLFLLGCAAVAALRFPDSSESPGPRTTASVVATETRLAVEVIANVFVVMGKAAVQPLTDWLHSISAAVRREPPAVHRLPGTNPPAS